MITSFTHIKMLFVKKKNCLLIFMVISLVSNYIIMAQKKEKRKAIRKAKQKAARKQYVQNTDRREALIEFNSLRSFLLAKQKV